MRELIQRLEAALFRRNPLLSEKLQPGMNSVKINNNLNRNNITGAINPIVELYSWKNGTLLDRDLRSSRSGFIPKCIYQFTELSRSIGDMRGFKEVARYHPRLSILVGRYFPFLWDGSCGWIALDISFSANNKIVTIRDQEKEPLREAYDSFDLFVEDVIRANEKDELLECFRNPGIPITEVEQIHLGQCDDSPGESKVKEERLLTAGDGFVLRTDFGDESAWESLQREIRQLNNLEALHLELVNAPKYKGITAQGLRTILPRNSILFCFIVDREALSRAEHPILAIDLSRNIERTFRVIPSQLGHIINNLLVGNMSFNEFAKAVDKDGVFRGF